MGAIKDQTDAIYFEPEACRLGLTRSDGVWEIHYDIVLVQIYNVLGDVVIHKVKVPLQLTETQKDTVIGVLETRLTEFAQNQGLALLPEE